MENQILMTDDIKNHYDENSEAVLMNINDRKFCFKHDFINASLYWESKRDEKNSYCSIHFESKARENFNPEWGTGYGGIRYCKKCKHIAINKNKCHIHCEENCSINRASLDIYEAPAKQIISLTCDYLPLGEITTILGPATYNEWKTNTGTVGIFGEYHGIPFDEVFGKINKHTTLIFPNFIKVLLDTNTKIQYDLLRKFTHP